MQINRAVFELKTIFYKSGIRRTVTYLGFKRTFSDVTDDIRTNRFFLRNPRGTRDYGPQEVVFRENIINKVRDCFKRHGAKPIDTPVMELKEVLTRKYGEESKLIYDLDDEENLSLRYDLTVPFARYLAMHKDEGHFKRYQIGKVYRKEDRNIGQGRYREFYQCDFDIAGKFDSMIADAECVKVVAEVLDELKLNYLIRVNHRKIMKGICEVFEVASEKHSMLYSSLDKLDTRTWEDVRQEIINFREISTEVADKIGKYINQSGGYGLVSDLLINSELTKNESALQGLKEVQEFLKCCEMFNLKDRIRFDLCLARGLDYYTGMIFEAVILDNELKRIGSIAGGGRYNNLVSSLDKKQHIPCVGVSVGLERIFTILQTKQKDNIRSNETQVYVASAEKNFANERMKLCSQLWEARINSEMSYKNNPGLLHQIQYCEKHLIPWLVITGTFEIQQNVVKIRNVKTREEIHIPQIEMVERLKELLL